MRYVVAVVGRKGGVGKSTVAANLAHALTLRGRNVVAFDLDPQANLAFTLGDRRDLFPVRVIGPGVRLSREMPAEGFVVLDTPPGVSDTLIDALGVADLLLLPMPPSVHALVNAAGLIDRIREEARPPAFRFVLNLFDERQALCRDIEAELERVYRGQICRTRIPRSAWIERAHATNRTVLEAAPNSRAAEAFRRLAGEVVNHAR